MRGSSDTEDYDEEAGAQSAGLGARAGLHPSLYIITLYADCDEMRYYCLRHRDSRGGDRHYPLSLSTAPAAPREASEELQLRQGLGRGAGQQTAQRSSVADAGAHSQRWLGYRVARSNPRRRRQQERRIGRQGRVREGERQGVGRARPDRWRRPTGTAAILRRAAYQ